eukprot:m.340253 g.340253  ORF g.340253 m.340253 type:complete len:2995 (+) comp16101_c0_seq1:496-9480(+)
MTMMGGFVWLSIAAFLVALGAPGVQASCAHVPLEFKGDVYGVPLGSTLTHLSNGNCLNQDTLEVSGWAHCKDIDCATASGSLMNECRVSCQHCQANQKTYDGILTNNTALHNYPGTTPDHVDPAISYKVPTNFECRDHEMISFVRSTYSADDKDRSFGFRCSPVGSGSGESPPFVILLANELHATLSVSCHETSYHEQVLSGMFTCHEDSDKDRRFSPYCRPIRGATLYDCATEKAPLNKAKQDFEYTVPEGHVLTGLHIAYDSANQDRIFFPTLCKIKCDQHHKRDGKYGCKSCGCVADEPTGTPADLVTSQHEGKVYFAWADRSKCETAFEFERDGQAFDSLFTASSAQECNAPFDPKSFADNLVEETGDVLVPVNTPATFPHGVLAVEQFKDEQKRYKFQEEIPTTTITATATPTTTTPSSANEGASFYVLGTSNGYVEAYTPLDRTLKWATLVASSGNVHVFTDESTGLIYAAGHETVACLNKAGAVQWQTATPSVVHTITPTIHKDILVTGTGTSVLTFRLTDGVLLQHKTDFDTDVVESRHGVLRVATSKVYCVAVVSTAGVVSTVSCVNIQSTSTQVFVDMVREDVLSPSNDLTLTYFVIDNQKQVIKETFAFSNAPDNPTQSHDWTQAALTTLSSDADLSTIQLHGSSVFVAAGSAVYELATSDLAVQHSYTTQFHGSIEYFVVDDFSIFATFSGYLQQVALQTNSTVSVHLEDDLLPPVLGFSNTVAIASKSSMLHVFDRTSLRQLRQHTLSTGSEPVGVALFQRTTAVLASTLLPSTTLPVEVTTAMPSTSTESFFTTLPEESQISGIDRCHSQCEQCPGCKGFVVSPTSAGYDCHLLNKLEETQIEASDSAIYQSFKMEPIGVDENKYRLYFGDTSGTLHAATDNNTLVWSKTITVNGAATAGVAPVVCDDGNLYVTAKQSSSAGKGTVAALDPLTGSILWQHDMPFQTNDPPICVGAGGIALLVKPSQCIVKALAIVHNQPVVVWSASPQCGANGTCAASSTSHLFQVLVDDTTNRVFLSQKTQRFSSAGGALQHVCFFGLELDTGHESWGISKLTYAPRDTTSAFLNLLPDDNLLFMYSSGKLGEVYYGRVNRLTGKETWTQSFIAEFVQIPEYHQDLFQSEAVLTNAVYNPTTNHVAFIRPCLISLYAVGDTGLTRYRDVAFHTSDSPLCNNPKLFVSLDDKAKVYRLYFRFDSAVMDATLTYDGRTLSKQWANVYHQTNDGLLFEPVHVPPSNHLLLPTGKGSLAIWTSGSTTALVDFDTVDKHAVSSRVVVHRQGHAPGYLALGSEEYCKDQCLESARCRGVLFLTHHQCALVSTLLLDHFASGHSSAVPLHTAAVLKKEQRYYPGTPVEYCAQATDPAEGYISQPTCTTHMVLWEARVSGIVKIEHDDFQLPVRDVTVEYRVGTSLGKVHTNADGEFSIPIATPSLRELEQNMTLYFSKHSGHVAHTFACSGLPCKSMTFLLRHLEVDKHVEVRDTTTVVFRGAVHIAGTEHSGHHLGCPLPSVEVCMHNRFTTEKVACVTTDFQGLYSIPAVVGTSVFLQLVYANSTDHTFVRITPEAAGSKATGTFVTDFGTQKRHPELYYDIEEGNGWHAVDFVDTTTQALHVQVAGGACNNVLGAFAVRFHLDGCPTWKREESTLGDQLLVKSWELPAHLIHVHVTDIKRGDETQSHIVQAIHQSANILTIDLSDVASIEASRKEYQRAKTRDISPPKQSVRFEYHPKPTIRASLTPVDAAAKTCETSWNVATSFTLIGLEISMSEDFGDTFGTCEKIVGNVTIENHLGKVDSAQRASLLTPAQKAILEACSETGGCSEQLVSDGQHSTLKLLLMTGEPNIAMPYTRAITVSFLQQGQYPQADSVTMHVVITGAVAIGGSDSFSFPRYMPLMVVQDPPGGSSVATYSSERAQFYVKNTEHEYYDTNILETSFGLALGTDADFCAGFLGVVCKKFLKIESRTGARIDRDSSDITVSGSGDGAVISTTIELSTSDDPITAGHYSDMVLVPAFDVEFVQVTVVGFDSSDPQSCHATSVSKRQWTIPPSDDKDKAFFDWLSMYDIEVIELPKLQHELTNTSLSSDKRTAIQNAINAWTATLNRNKEVRNLAQSKDSGLKLLVDMPNRLPSATLGESVSHLKDRVSKGKIVAAGFAPVETLQAMQTLDGQAASDKNVEDIASSSGIRFSGGGSTYTLTFDLSEEASKSSGGGTQKYAANLFTTDTQFLIAGIGAFVTIDAGSQDDTTDTSETETGDSREVFVSFTLGDPDPDDAFSVIPYQHPDYPLSVIFRTTGRSSCPHEEHTIALEKADISADVTQVNNVLPGGTVVFEVHLRNMGLQDYDGTFQLYQILVYDDDALTVTVDGHNLAVPLEFEHLVGLALPTKALVHVTHDPTSQVYGAQEVVLGLRSACEVGRAEARGTSYQESRVTLVTNFVQPCPSVKFAGALRSVETYVLNNANQAVTLELYNPDHATSKWADSSRLTQRGVGIDYRLVVNDLPGQWQPLTMDGKVWNGKSAENEHGYTSAAFDLNARTWSDGIYDFRSVVECGHLSAFPEPPPGIGSFYSPSVRMIVDREAPMLFGIPEPADRIHFPGDEISFQFSERLDCSRPFKFVLTVQVGSTTYDARDLLYVCHDNVVVTALRRFNAAEINGQSATATIQGVKDMYGNVMDGTKEHTFTFADINLESATTLVSGLKLSVPYRDEYNDTNRGEISDFITLLRTDVANLLQVDISRIEVSTINAVDTNDYSKGIVVSFKFHPSDGSSEAEHPMPQSARRSVGLARRGAGDNNDETAAHLAYLFHALIESGGISGELLETFDNSTVLTTHVEPSHIDKSRYSTSASSSFVSWDYVRENITIALVVIIFLQSCIIIWFVCVMRKRIARLLSRPSLASFDALSKGEKGLTHLPTSFAATQPRVQETSMPAVPTSSTSRTATGLAVNETSRPQRHTSRKLPPIQPKRTPSATAVHPVPSSVGDMILDVDTEI